MLIVFFKVNNFCVTLKLIIEYKKKMLFLVFKFF